MERFVNAVQSLAVEGRPFTAITHQQQLMALDSFVGFVQSGALAEQQFHDHGLLLQDSLLQWLLSSQFALAFGPSTWAPEFSTAWITRRGPPCSIAVVSGVFTGEHLIWQYPISPKQRYTQQREIMPGSKDGLFTAITHQQQWMALRSTTARDYAWRRTIMSYHPLSPPFATATAHLLLCKRTRNLGLHVMATSRPPTATGHGYDKIWQSTIGYAHHKLPQVTVTTRYGHEKSRQVTTMTNYDKVRAVTGYGNGPLETQTGCVLPITVTGHFLETHQSSDPGRMQGPITCARTLSSPSPTFKNTLASLTVRARRCWTVTQRA